MFDCYCDYEPWDFCRTAMPKARKQYHCGECQGYIVPGEKYEYIFGVYCGDTTLHRTCTRCLTIREWVQINIPCFCWSIGDLNQYMRDTVYEAAAHAPEETIGLRFGLLRHFALRDRHNAAQRALLSSS